MSQAESKIFAETKGDYDQLFVELFSIYIQEIYGLCLAAVQYNEEIAYQLVQDIFTTAYKYVHVFTPQQGSFRIYLLTITVKEIRQLDARVPAMKQQLPKKIKAKLKPAGEKLWQAVHALPRLEWLVYELWYGEQLSTTDIATVLEKSMTEIQTLQTLASQRLRQVNPQFVEYITKLFSLRTGVMQLPRSQEVRLLRTIMNNRRARPSFVAQTWWAPLTQVWPVAGVVLSVGVLGVVTWVTLTRPVWLFPVTVQTNTVAVADTANTNAVVTPTPDITTLPVVTSQKLSLTDIDHALFGTDYNIDRPSTDDADSITPTVLVNVAPESYIPVTQAYSYAMPESLDSDQLQFAALKHFSSLPLNQFTYVNGTYYLQEQPNTFQPLFVALNTDGKIEFQMRQAAICALPDLTAVVDDATAQTAGFNWLVDHNFTEVAQTDLQISRISSDNRTVPQDTFCNDGKTTPVEDRQFVYYPPHTVLRYGTNVTDVLPLRMRGVSIEVHSDNVTQVHVDRLDLLTQYIVRTNQVDLKPLATAITDLKAFVYPSSAEKADKDRFAQVYAQWNHLHGDDRLTSMTIDQVRLEYVFDELNHIVEPYYVFSGQGTNVKGEAEDIRMYVVASTESKELRGPYRE